MTAEVRLPADELERWTRDLLVSAGLERDAATTVAASLIETSLRGIDSHGVARVPIYCARLRAGGINPRPRPRIVREDGAVALIDGDTGPGQVAGVMAMSVAIRLARQLGVGATFVRRSSHYGAAGYYAMQAARAGLVGVSTTNAELLVVPFGGATPALGTNPIAVAAPLPDGGVFCLDMATSQVAMNRIFNARDEGRPIPEGWGVDTEGRGTTDATRAVAGVPLGGYKGYGLAIVVELLSAVLSGAGVARDAGVLYGADAEPQDIGHFQLALDPERLVGREAAAASLAGLLQSLKQIAPAPEHDEVLVPGEPEERAETARRRDGVPLTGVLAHTLAELSAELDVPAPTRVLHQGRQPG